MYHPARKKTYFLSIILFIHITNIETRSFQATENPDTHDDNFENNFIDFDDEYANKYNKKFGFSKWNDVEQFNRKTHRYTIINDFEDDFHSDVNNKENVSTNNDSTTTEDYRVIPLELITTTENKLISIIESTTEADLTVIPLSTTQKVPNITIPDTITLPVSTENPEITITERIEILKQDNTTTETVNNVNLFVDTKTTKKYETTTGRDIFKQKNPTTEIINVFKVDVNNKTTGKFESTTEKIEIIKHDNNITTENINTTATKVIDNFKIDNETTENFETTTLSASENNEFNVSTENFDETTIVEQITRENFTDHELKNINNTTEHILNSTEVGNNTSTDIEIITTTKLELTKENENKTDQEFETDVPIFTELDAEEEIEVPEDYYDTKDIVPTTAPRTDALSVIFGLAGSVVESVVESVAERVVPKSVFDLFKRMQRQSEALESERLRSKEENGGIGQFTRGIIKTISTGISKPFSQLMAGARDIGSLDTDRGFVSSLASGVTSVANVANSVVDTFKDRVQAIYPGTVWCGDGRSATARSSDLGLFFFTDTCCRQHDACKLYIRAGETKHGLTNTGLFTRSHCSCDTKFRECLRRTNSLVSAQIGLTYFNVLGPQCFRRAHPIVRCVRRTRITGLKCEEYELDYTKPRMWQWFDNETF